MATVYPEARNLCAVVTYTRSPIRVRETAAWSGRAVAWLWELVACIPMPHILLMCVCVRFGEVYSPPFPCLTVIGRERGGGTSSTQIVVYGFKSARVN